MNKTLDIEHPILRKAYINKQWEEAKEHDKNRELKKAKQRLLELEEQQKQKRREKQITTEQGVTFKMYDSGELSLSMKNDVYDETFRADIHIKGATYKLTDKEKKHLIHILENSLDE